MYSVHIHVKMDSAVAVEIFVFLAVLHVHVCNSVIPDNLPSFKSCHKLLTDLRVVVMVTFTSHLN